MLSLTDFEKLAQAWNVIPLVRTIPADLHTPVSTYLTLREPHTHSFLLESAEPDERIGRFSFVGTSPAMLIVGRGDEVTIEEGGERTRTGAHVVDVLKETAKRFRQAPGIAGGGFTGGFLGYLGYDCVPQFEHVPLPAPSASAPPDALFGLFTIVVRFDHRRQVVTVIRNVLVNPVEPLAAQFERGRRDLDAVILRLSRAPVLTSTFACAPPTPSTARDREAYCHAVRRAKEHITEGEVFQVVLSRRSETPFTGDPFPVYRALRLINPSPYLFHIDFGETVLTGSSPELLVRVNGRKVEVMPIAGTRQRSPDDAEEDQRLADELLADEKERAEHVMLIDLGRNDVGRIAAYGSVSVPEVMRIERYSHVMHIVSTVRGTLRDDVGALDALVSCFPAGTVSGAPKIRAMEIIAELEGRRRGVYAGAVGYLGFDGTLDTCIAIRTVVCHRGVLAIQAGAGIVADSDPGREFTETENKARALVDAVTLAAGGLRGETWEELAGRIAQ